MQVEYSYMSVVKWGCHRYRLVQLFIFILHLPWQLAGKDSTCNGGDPGSILGSGRCPREGIGYPFQYSWASLVTQMVKNPPAMQDTWLQSLGWEDPLQYSGLENSMDRGAWPATVNGIDLRESDTAERFSLRTKDVSPFKNSGGQHITGRCVCVCVCVLVTQSCLRPHRLQSTRFLCPWDSPGKNT